MAVPQEGLQPHSSPQLPTTTYGGRERSHSHPMMTIFRTRHRAAPGMLLPYPWQPPPRSGYRIPASAIPHYQHRPQPGGTTGAVTPLPPCCALGRSAGALRAEPTCAV